MDYAGGTVVHINAGVAALVAALVLGRRRGFPETPMPPHNLAMTVTGACMLWVGWFGFNAGSALAADGTAGMTMLVTHVGAAAGSVAWMTAEWVRFGKPSVLGIVTGMVAGLGTITPASGFVGPLGALAIGATAGIVCFLATNHMKRRLHIDDSLDVFPVHGVGGALGTLATGLFAATEPRRRRLRGRLLRRLADADPAGGRGCSLRLVRRRHLGAAKGGGLPRRRARARRAGNRGLDIVLHNETGYNF